MNLDIIRRIRTGGLYSLAKERFGSEDFQEIVTDDDAGIATGVYMTVGSVFGTDRHRSFAFCCDGTTLVAPYHAVGDRILPIGNKMYAPTLVDDKADITLYGGHNLNVLAPVPGCIYMVKNPVLKEAISLKCEKITSEDVCIFTRVDGQDKDPLEGWSGLPIIDRYGRVYGIYSVHVKDFNTWTTRCKVSLVGTTSRDWKRVVDNALSRGFVNIVAGTGAGKTVGITTAMLEKGIKNGIVLQPTRAMVENLYGVVHKHYKDIGFIHGEGSYNPTAGIVIMTYGSFLMRTISGFRSKPKLIFCDEVHELKAEVQATILYLDRHNIHNRIYATATPNGDVREHSGRFTIVDATMPAETCDDCFEVGGVGKICTSVLKTHYNKGILIFYPTKNTCEEIARNIRAKMGTKEVLVVTSDNVNDARVRSSLCSDKGKIIVATNCLETGVTVNVGVLIDSGKTYCPYLSNDEVVQRTTRTMAFQQAQRRGRVGRIKDGIYYLLDSSPNMEYDKYKYTYQYLAIYCKALKMILPEEVTELLSSCPTLENMISSLTDKQIRAIINREKLDPIMLMQYVNSMGQVWAPVRKYFKLYQNTSTSSVDTSGWDVDTGLVKKPKFLQPGIYLDSEGTVRRTNYTVPLAFGILAMSYAFNKLANKTWTNYATNLVCTWDEYVGADYFEVREIRSGGRAITVLFTSQLDYASLTNACFGFMRDITMEYFGSPEVTQLMVNDSIIQVRECVNETIIPISDSVMGVIFARFLNAPSFTDLPMPEPLQPIIVVEKTVEIVKEVSVLDRVMQAIPHEYYLPKIIGLCDKVKEFNYLQLFNDIADSVKDSCTTFYVRASSNSETTIFESFRSFFSNFTRVTSCTRAIATPTYFSIKTCTASLMKGIIFANCGFGFSPSSYAFGGLIRTTTCKEYSQVFSLWGNMLIEAVGQGIQQLVLDQEYYTTSIITKLFSAPHVVQPATSVFTTHVKAIALMASAALAGVTVATAFVSNVEAPCVTTTATVSGRLPMTVGAGCTSMGLTFGVGLGIIKSYFDSVQEEKMNAISNQKNPNVLLSWMENVGRTISLLSVFTLKCVVISGFSLISPKLSIYSAVAAALYNGFNQEAVNSVVEWLPSIHILSSCLIERDIPGIVWACVGPIACQLVGPAIGSALTLYSNFQATVSFTEGTVMAASHSYGSIAAVNKEFNIFGDVLMIGEGVGGMSQYITTLPSVATVDRVCAQEYTLPSLAKFGDESKLRNFYKMDIRNFDTSNVYDVVIIDIYGDDYASIKHKLRKIIDTARPSRIISSNPLQLDGYGLVKNLCVNNVSYHCYVQGHITSHAPVKHLEMSNEIEVYLPATNYSFKQKALPNLGKPINTNVSKSFESRTLETVGRVSVNRPFEPNDKLRINPFLWKTLAIKLDGQIKNITQASRRLDKYREAIRSRVDIPQLPVRSLLFQDFKRALDIVIRDEAHYEPYTFKQALNTITRTGAGGLTDCYNNIGNWIDDGNAKDLDFDKTKVIWSMTPKYENRKAAKGDFPPPRIVTMSNFDFRFFSHQVLGPLNEESIIRESNGKMPFFVMMNKLMEKKMELELKYGEPYVFYAGDVSIWDARPSPDHIRALFEAISKKHSRPDLVMKIMEQQVLRFCLTCDGEVLLKQGGIDSGSVTTKFGNDGLNAGRDLVCIAVSLGMSLEQVYGMIWRLVCGDDFVGLCPARFADQLRKHYARVSKELGFPLKEEICITNDASSVEFCSHFWIKSARGNAYLPYRNRRDILERLVLQPTSSDMNDLDRAASKILSCLLLYGHDPILRNILSEAIDELGIQEFHLSQKDAPYLLNVDVHATKKDLSKVLDSCYREWYGTSWVETFSHVEKRARINGTSINYERVSQSSMRPL